MMRPFFSTAALVPMLVLGGCSFDIDFPDVVCSTREANLATPPTDVPLAVGTTIHVTTEDTDDAGVTETITAESTDPGIFESVTDDVGNLRFVARAPGTASIVLRRANGTEHGRRTFEVRAHDRIALVSKTAMLAGATELDATVAVPRIVEDGQANYYVRLFAADLELRAQGFLLNPDLGTPNAIAILSLDSHPPEASLHPTASGAQEVAVEWLGSAFESPPESELFVAVESVPESAVTSVGFATDESAAAVGTCITAAPIARDAGGVRIDGVEFGFRGNSDDFGDGEVLNYEHDPSNPIEIRASVGRIGATTTIHGKPADVRASDAAGCSVGGAAAATQLAPALVALAWIAASRRRRVRAQR